MKPPLRTKRDNQILQKALKEGVINIVATDHAPHPDYKKEMEFSEAAFGVIGLETSFSVLYTELVEKKKLSLDRLIEVMSLEPSKVFRLPLGEIKKGAIADFALVDLKASRTIDRGDFVSKSENSAFLGRKVKGVVEYCIVDGKIVYKKGEFLR
jgi:dihydroorotase